MSRLAPALFLLLAATAAANENGATPPLVDAAGRAAYRDYLGAGGHRAFAVAPGGTWAWNGDADSADAAVDRAVDECRRATSQRCVPFSRDGRVVFDAAGWNTLWRPDLDGRAARRAKVGIQRGQRFHDLALRSPAGAPIKLSDLRGEVVVLHFWGSWCRPCRQEIPELQELERKLGRHANVRFVLVQVRESIAQARSWARAQKVDLALYDSGVAGSSDEYLKRAGGKPIRDREIAFAFPSTYVLDRNGIVLFSHVGPVGDWPGYLPLLRDAAAH